MKPNHFTGATAGDADPLDKIGLIPRQTLASQELEENFIYRILVGTLGYKPINWPAIDHQGPYETIPLCRVPIEIFDQMFYFVRSRPIRVAISCFASHVLLELLPAYLGSEVIRQATNGIDQT